MSLFQAQRRRLILSFLLLLAFLFRLFFGLCSQFLDPDTKQIYLLGLKFFTTGAWPYFGPDVTPTIQIPGALQGLLVGLPFHLLPIPEAPYVLVNILSFASLCFLPGTAASDCRSCRSGLSGAGCSARPGPLILSTHISTLHMFCPGAILFFVGAIETYPFLSRGLIPRAAANLMMGLALFWITQLHLSWVVLVPYVALSFYFQFRSRDAERYRRSRGSSPAQPSRAVFLFLPSSSTDLARAWAAQMRKVEFNSENLWRHLNVVEGVLGRFLSFASYELPRFIGANTAARLAFMKENPWLIPFVAFLTLVGILQCVALLVLWFRKAHSQKDWPAIKYFTLGTVVLLYLEFSVFTEGASVPHVLPHASSGNALQFLLLERVSEEESVAEVCCRVPRLWFDFRCGLAISNYKHVSIYRERGKVVEAIKAKDYRRVGRKAARRKILIWTHSVGRPSVGAHGCRKAGCP